MQNTSEVVNIDPKNIRRKIFEQEASFCTKQAKKKAKEKGGSMPKHLCECISEVSSDEDPLSTKPLTATEQETSGA